MQVNDLKKTRTLVNQRGERSRSGSHEIRGTVISVVVGVRVLRTLDLINYLHTTLSQSPKLCHAR